MQKLVTLTLVVALLWTPLWADSGSDVHHLEKVRKKVAAALNQPRRIIVDTYDNRRLQGFVSEAESDSFVLTLSGRSTTLAYADVKTIRGPRHVPREVVAAIVAVGVAVALYGIVILINRKNG